MSSTHATRTSDATKALNQQSNFYQDVAQLFKDPKFNNALKDIAETAKSKIPNPPLEEAQVCVIVFGVEVCVDV